MSRDQVELIVDDLNTWLLEDPTRYAGKVVSPNIQWLAKQGVPRSAWTRCNCRRRFARGFVFD